MPIARYFVERLTAHSDVWMVKFDDEERGPYKSQSEAVHRCRGKTQRTRREGASCHYRTDLDPRPGHQPRSVVSCAGILRF